MTIEKYYTIEYKRKEDSYWMTLSWSRFNSLDSALECERSERNYNGDVFDYRVVEHKQEY
jgi:hypothetical protein